MHAKAASRLLHHYREHARALPWRAPPGSGRQEPYRVWLSEVMLQQTTVATVTPRFLRFIERWPTIETLAAAPDEQILAEWAGLGYYARARNLIACARAIVARGGFPSSEAELRKLPGLGAYTAAAIAAIAFGEDAVPVDTNVERVVARVFGLADRTEVRAAAGAWWPVGDAGDFAQACMDLGATVCRPKAPACPYCPLRADCRAAALGTPELFPAPKARKVRPHRFGLAWWARRDDEVWLTRRPATGLLGGMAALPGPEWSDERPAANPLAVHRHGFTHFTLDLLVVRVAEPIGDGWWQPLADLADAGLPTLYRRAIEAALHAERERRLAA
ncbi:A/G-specific adenine glycosylase [Sphingomonas sp. BN140010]|uniref:Adenine DNA glycosylase n=1 Tax=Sphingomonas arvum TaxID=2992113 RepID=A0ABT3JBD5_9SPHN|nr:A/G-specific adenine glycosylase [Sphingomonas sp. BN140010]MCW3796370.1 A/G-specific adenine glycosylase [Sphingomonas sp. BN140010]